MCVCDWLARAMTLGDNDDASAAARTKSSVCGELFDWHSTNLANFLTFCNWILRKGMFGTTFLWQNVCVCANGNLHIRRKFTN